MTSKLLVSGGRIEIGMNENSRNRSDLATPRRRNHVKVAGCDRVPERVDELVLVVQHTLGTCEDLQESC